jgi:hypothetical protein
MAVEKRSLNDFAAVEFDQAVEPLVADNVTGIVLIFWIDDVLDFL